MNVSWENFITVVFLAKQVQKRFGKRVYSFQTLKKGENTKSTKKTCAALQKLVSVLIKPRRDDFVFSRRRAHFTLKVLSRFSF